MAHLAIARAALNWADEVVWVLPRVFPHKAFDGATFDQRCAMLRDLAASEPGFSAAVSDANLHYQIADESRPHFPAATDIALLCGRDAAERIARWDYGRPGVFEAMLDSHPLLVASRQGEFLPAPAHAARIIPVTLEGDFNEVSSTEIRRRLSIGGDWQSLVPPAIHDHARRAYGAA